MLNLYKFNRLASSTSINLFSRNLSNNSNGILLKLNSTPTTTTLSLLNLNDSIGNSNNRYYSKSNHKYTRRASYTHQQDIKSLKKREAKKEAAQQHTTPVEFPHSKKAHEHTKPLNHQEKLDLKKKLKARRKEEIKKDNAERVKHIMVVEDDAEKEVNQLQQSGSRSLRNPSTSSLLNVAASSVSTEKGEEIISSLVNNSKSKLVSNIEFDENEPYIADENDFEDEEDDDDHDDRYLDEVDDDDEGDDNDVGDYRHQYEDDAEEDYDNDDQYEDLDEDQDHDLEEYDENAEEDDQPEFDLSAIDPSRIIEVDAEMLKDLPTDDDGQIIMPDFISFEDAQKKYGFTERELKDSAYSYAVAEAARQLEAEKKQKKKGNKVSQQDEIDEDEDEEQEVVKKISKKSSKKSTKQQVEEDEDLVDDHETTRKKQQKLDKSLRKQQHNTESPSDQYQSVEDFVKDKHLQKLQSARGTAKMHEAKKGPVSVSEIMEVLADTKLEDFCVIDVSDKCKWTKYMIIASSDSNRVILNAEEDLLEKFQHRFKKGHQPRNPADDSDVWRVLDLEDCLVHLFETSTREYYDLETLWVTRRPVGSEEQSWDDEKTDMIAERTQSKND